MKNKKGFTLLEIMVAVGVVAIMMTVLTPMIRSFIRNAQVRVATSNCETAVAAMTAYIADNPDNTLQQAWNDLANKRYIPFNPAAEKPVQGKFMLFGAVPGGKGVYYLQILHADGQQRDITKVVGLGGEA